VSACNWCLVGEHEVADRLSHKLAVSENGWIDNDHCQTWLEESFLPQVMAHNHSRKPILLICDGHGSHCTFKLLLHAKLNNIFILKLVPHTTHMCQPLDVGILGPLQTAFAKGVDEFVADHGRGINKKEFIEIYLKARTEAIVPLLITSAFKHCGICPLNPEIFTAKDFAPSKGYSTAALSHLPQGFQEAAAPENNEIDDDQQSQGAKSCDLDFIDPDNEARGAHDSSAPSDKAPIDSQHTQQPSPMRSLSPDDTVLTPHGLNNLKSDLLGYCLALEIKGRVQEIKLADARREAEEAHTHAVILGRQYTDVMNVQNAKKKTRTSSTFDAQARVMNTNKAMLILQNEEDARLAELARIEALEAGYQHCLELQILNAPCFPWFHAAAAVVINREKAIVATEKAAVKATANAAKEAKAAAAKAVNAARRLEEKEVCDAKKARKLVLEKEVKALEKAAKAVHESFCESVKNDKELIFTLL
jgi:hypothetical protein